MTAAKPTDRATRSPPTPRTPAAPATRAMPSRAPARAPPRASGPAAPASQPYDPGNAPYAPPAAPADPYSQSAQPYGQANPSYPQGQAGWSLPYGQPAPQAPAPYPYSAYPPQGPSYSPQPPGYPAQPSGYPPQPSGYAPQPPGYPPQPPGYPAWPAYPPAWTPVSRPWENLPPWLKRTLRYYLYGLIAALLLVGILFLVNVWVPLGRQNIGRSIGSLFLLLLGWLWGLFGAAMLRYKPLVPAAVLGMATGAATIIFGPIAVWDLVGSYNLARIPWSLFWMQLVAAAAVAGVRALHRGEYPMLNLPGLAAIAIGGIMLALGVLIPEDSVSDRFTDKLAASGAGLAFPLCAAAALFLLPARPRLNFTRYIAYAGFAELALFLAIVPWIEDDAMLDRMQVAAWAIAIVLGLVALTFFIIDQMDLRKDAPRQGTA